MRLIQRFAGGFFLALGCMFPAGSGSSIHAQEKPDSSAVSAAASMVWINILARGPGEVWFHDFPAARADTETLHSFPTNSPITLHARTMPDAIFLGWFGSINTNILDVSYRVQTNQVIEARFISKTMQLRASATGSRRLLVSLTNSFPVGIDLEVTSDFKEWKPFLKHSRSNNPPFEITPTNGPQLFFRSNFLLPP